MRGTLLWLRLKERKRKDTKPSGRPKKKKGM